MAKTEKMQFLLEFVKSPARTGAVSPSSKRLADRMIEWIDWSKIQTVVEIGPGTGAITTQILSRLDSTTKFFVIERNTEFCGLLAQRIPGLSIHNADVREIGEVCEREGVRQIDAVISGLPWASLGNAEQLGCLQAVAEVLPHGGAFATFAYIQGLILPAAGRFRRRLAGVFSTVESSKTVWRNFPPALVYRCRR